MQLSTFDSEDYHSGSCSACQILEDYTSLHNGHKVRSSQSLLQLDHLKIQALSSTMESIENHLQMVEKTPTESEIGVEEQSVVGDWSEGQNSDLQEVQNDPISAPPTETEGIRGPARRVGAPRKKKRDLDTFKPKMWKWIRDHTLHPAGLPSKMNKKTLPLVIAAYPNEVLEYLILEACQLVPPKPSSEQGRDEWHIRRSFKQQARKLLWEYFKHAPSQ